MRAHPKVVYKSVSHARSITSQSTSADEQRLAALSKCPALFQAFVDGPDYRVHTVGERALATRIKAGGTDYRFAGQAASYRSATVAEPIAERLIVAARSSGLWLSGVDLRISERDGSWFVFEINRMPAFDFYDHRSGSRVADAIIDMARG
jgi:glutathione synthase/RimK-type ligase-like ATP-grasp enzyme